MKKENSCPFGDLIPTGFLMHSQEQTKQNILWGEN